MARKDITLSLVQDGILLITGESAQTVETTSTIVKYFFFSATSISYADSIMTLEYDDYNSWNVDACVVKCLNDHYGKTFAIRITADQFEAGENGAEKREIHVYGTIYTTSLTVNTNYDIYFRITECPPAPTYVLSFIADGDASAQSYSFIDLFNRNIEAFSDASGSTACAKPISGQQECVNEMHIINAVARKCRGKKDSDYDSYLNDTSGDYVEYGFITCNDEEPIEDNSRILNVRETVFIPCGLKNDIYNNIEYTYEYDTFNNEGKFILNSPVEVIGYHTFFFGKHYNCASTIPAPEDDAYISDVNRYGEYLYVPGETVVGSDSKLLDVSGGTSDEVTYRFDLANLIRSFNVGDFLRVIGNQAFKELPALESIDFGKSPLERIGSYAFEGDTSLTEIQLPETVRLIGEGAFKRSGLTNIEIPKNLEYIEAETFRDCVDLLTVDFTKCEKLKKILPSAFQGCTSIENIIMPDSLERIERCTFKGCQELGGIEWGKNLISVGASVFEGTCIADIDLTNITEHTCHFQKHSFKGCDLSSIIFGDNKRFGENSLYGTSAALTIGKGCHFDANACKNMGLAYMYLNIESADDIPVFDGYYPYPHGIHSAGVFDEERETTLCNLFVSEAIWNLMNDGVAPSGDHELIDWLKSNWMVDNGWGDVYAGDEINGYTLKKIKVVTE